MEFVPKDERVDKVQVDDSEEEPKWYVVHTYSGYENKIKAAIDKVVDNRGMREQILEVRIPTREVVEKKNGKTTVTESNLYPGYLFIRMHMSDDAWYTIRNTQGVTGFVGPGAKPSALSERDLKSMGLAEEPKILDEYAVGDEITVIEGPLEGFTGTIDEVNPQQGKVRVNLSMFGRMTPTELEFSQIHKLKP